MKLSDYVIDFLINKGVKHVFMLPGGGAMHLNDSLGQRSADIQFVPMLHEQAVAVAAEAYSRTVNGLGVAMVTAGPGGTNTITGVAAAWLDSTPVLFLAGQVKRPDLARGKGLRQLGVQEIDLPSIVSPITKYAATVLDPTDVKYHLERAVALCKIGRPGPCWLEFPLDVQVASIEPDTLRGFDPATEIQQPDHADLSARVTETIRLFNEADRPVILLGNGVRIAGAVRETEKFVELLNCPALTTRLGVDLIPWAHDLCFGMPGALASRGANFTLQNSDFLLILGARLDMALIAYAPEKLARAARKIMVNIDAVEIGKLGDKIDLAVPYDARDFLDEMVRQKAAILPRNRAAWLDRCNDWKVRYPFVTEKHRAPASGLSTYLVSDVLSDEIEEGDVILPGSSGTACEIFLTAFRARKNQRIFHNKGTGAMGLSQPSAIGACLASGRRTISIDGDGGFFMNIQELGTIRSLNLPIKMFVINNSGYASIRSSQRAYFGRMMAADSESGLNLPSVIDVSRAFGIRANRIDRAEDLRAATRSVLDQPGPSVCEILVPKDEPREPRITSRQRPDGTFVSSPLEDLFPFLDREEFKANMLVPMIGE
jgi:acetolactate synthase-1/2/3 large subunit